MAGHTEGEKEGKFCSKRMEKCPCGNKYKAIMSGTESWGKYKQKHKKLVAVERSPEAHHVLPVASVTRHVTCNRKIRYEVVKNTEWCVNVEANMIALPLFEMTLTHYLIASDFGAVAAIVPPPFAGLPMHNYGHGKFQTEVNDSLKNVAKDAEENIKNHEEATKTLTTALNKDRDHFKRLLEDRGKRGEGTHVEFLHAMGLEVSGSDFTGSAPRWYVPFAMAKKPSKRSFPSRLKKDALSKKLNDLIQAIADWSAIH